MMDMEKLFERLLAIMETNKEDLLAKIDARLEKMDNSHKVMAAETKPDRDMEEMVCRESTETHLVMDEKMMACQEMEARQEVAEPSSVDMKPETAEERQFLVEDAEVMAVGEPKKKRRRDRKLAAERRRQKNERAQCQGGCRTKGLAAARRGTCHRAEVARKMQTDKKMPRRTTVARRMRDIFRPNTTRLAKWHGARNMSSEKFVPGTMWYEEHRKDGLQDGDN
jgi:hypothetical protein